jgi:hypothetical protein
VPFSFAVLLSHGCSLDMTLDEVSVLLLGCNYSSSAYICILLFWAFLMLVATTAPQTLRGLLAVGPDIARVLEVVALRKASLSSV